MVSGLPDSLQTAVRSLRERPVAVTDKGFGGLAWSAPVSAASLARGRPSLRGGDFVLPLMVLRESALAGNIEAMADYCRAAGVLLAPHGKTTMAPQLLARQLAAGAWGVTAAMISQVQVFRSVGIPRIVIANEITDRAAIDWLAGELEADPEFDCYCFVDSVAGVVLLDEALQQHAARSDDQNIQPRLRVLVELGTPGGRAGCRGVEEAVAVARAVAEAPTLRLAGAAGYEGAVGHDDTEGTLSAIAAFCRDLRRLGEELAVMPGCEDGYLLSAGGSAYFDVVVAELTASHGGTLRPTVVLRSGAYISHDHGFYQRVSPGARPGRPGPLLQPAFELWATVLSAPEPGLAIIGAGRHDVAFDQDMPVPLRIWRNGNDTADSAGAAGMVIISLDDQHGYLRLPPESELGPGDLVCMGISHPCTNFDKWRVIPVVDDDDRVIDAIHTFF
jgi:D-serine deaminase-like pyridoxal phosphate-dependent protein